MVLAETPRNRALPFDLGLVNRRGLSANSACGLKYLQYSRGAATMLLWPALIAPLLRCHLGDDRLDVIRPDPVRHQAVNADAFFHSHPIQRRR